MVMQAESSAVRDIPIETPKTEVNKPSILKYDDWLSSAELTKKGNGYPFYAEYVICEISKLAGYEARQTEISEEVPGGGDVAFFTKDGNHREIYIDAKMVGKIEHEGYHQDPQFKNVFYLTITKPTVEVFRSALPQTQQQAAKILELITKDYDKSLQ